MSGRTVSSQENSKLTSKSQKRLSRLKIFSLNFMLKDSSRRTSVASGKFNLMPTDQTSSRLTSRSLSSRNNKIELRL